jgi:hypothetical protein
MAKKFRPPYDPKPGYHWEPTPGGGWRQVPDAPSSTTKPPAPGDAWVWDENRGKWMQPPKPDQDYEYSWDDNAGWIRGNKIVTPQEAANAAAETERNQQSAIAYLTGLLQQYGLDSLVGKVSDLVKDWGTADNIIVSRLRETDEYRARFAGNELRTKNGYNALSEAEYLSSEDAIKTTMRKYGLDSAFYTADKIATLIGGDVAATEVDSRISQAKKVIDSADLNIKNALVNMYGVGMADMLGYALDPSTGEEILRNRVNAGFASGVAAGQGIDLGTSLAEQVGSLTFGDERTLRAQFNSIGDLARSSERLGNIDNETVSGQDVVRGEFGLDTNADQRVKKLQSRERARFSGSSAQSRGTFSSGGI